MKLGKKTFSNQNLNSNNIKHQYGSTTYGQQYGSQYGNQYGSQYGTIKTADQKVK